MRGLWVVLLLVPLAGCAEPEGTDCPEWHCREGYADDPAWRESTIPGRTALEMDFARKAGEPLEWDWFQPQRVRLLFGLHYHDQTATGVRDEDAFQREVAEDEGSYMPDAPRVYSLQWSNLGTEPVKVWLRVEGFQSANFIPLG